MQVFCKILLSWRGSFPFFKTCQLIPWTNFCFTFHLLFWCWVSTNCTAVLVKAISVAFFFCLFCFPFSLIFIFFLFPQSWKVLFYMAVCLHNVVTEEIEANYCLCVDCSAQDKDIRNKFQPAAVVVAISSAWNSLQTFGEGKVRAKGDTILVIYSCAVQMWEWGQKQEAMEIWMW